MRTYIEHSPGARQQFCAGGSTPHLASRACMTGARGGKHGPPWRHGGTGARRRVGSPLRRPSPCRRGGTCFCVAPAPSPAKREGLRPRHVKHRSMSKGCVNRGLTVGRPKRRGSAGGREADRAIAARQMAEQRLRTTPDRGRRTARRPPARMFWGSRLRRRRLRLHTVSTRDLDRRGPGACAQGGES